ncbi:MAG: n-acetylglutamate synthase [Rubrivivax sp.]|nr:n-acetylglutamate synthase [Pyrinomonadaceae bacterium]
MSAINYNERTFAAVSNSEGGEVSSETIFHYRQEGDVVWATYAGGEVAFGTLVAKALGDGSLDMRYSHVNLRGELMTGVCRSTPEVLPDGRLRLHERWRWTCGDFSGGESVVEEFKLN